MTILINMLLWQFPNLIEELWCQVGAISPFDSDAGQTVLDKFVFIQ